MLTIDWGSEQVGNPVRLPATVVPRVGVEPTYRLRGSGF